jgi:hypothetical protein
MIKYFLDILSQRQDFLLKNVDKIQTIKTQTLQRQINEINQVIKQLHLTILGKLPPIRPNVLYRVRIEETSVSYNEIIW